MKKRMNLNLKVITRITLQIIQVNRLLLHSGLSFIWIYLSCSVDEDERDLKEEYDISDDISTSYEDEEYDPNENEDDEVEDDDDEYNNYSGEEDDFESS